MTPRWTRLARLYLRVGLATLLAALATAPPPVAAGATAGASPAVPCALPLTHDRYAGFHIGVPAGWDLSTLNGSIAVSRDPSGTEAALVYPTLLTQGMTPVSLLSAALHVIQQSTVAAGNTMSYHITATAGRTPEATLSGRMGGQQLQGAATVLLLRDPTARASYQAVFSAYWAPTARLAADRAELAGIGRCYGPEPGTLYQIFRDQVFTLAIPLGWKVLDEGQDSVDLTGEGGQAAASYLLLFVPPTTGVTSPRSLLTYVFGLIHIRITQILSSIDLPSQQLANGAVQGQEYAEFLGQYQGKAVHGLVYMLSDVGSVGVSGVMRLGVAAAGRWNAVNSGLIHVMGSIQHDFTQDLQQWAHINQQWQEFDRTAQQFDNVINGVDVVRDPTTGTLYEAPYDHYSQSGPDGPGYYRDTGAGILQKLEVVQQ